VSVVGEKRGVGGSKAQPPTQDEETESPREVLGGDVKLGGHLHVIVITVAIITRCLYYTTGFCQKYKKSIRIS